MVSKSNSQPTDPKKDGLWQAIKGGNELSSLLRRFGNTPFTEKNAAFKYAAVAFSFFINILSVAGSFYGLYWLASFISSYPLPVAVLCVALLAILEWAKRKSSDNFWDIYHFKNQTVGGWLAFSFFLFSISATLSVVGTYQGIKDYAPAAVLITTDSTSISLEKQIAFLDDKIEAAENTKWRGTTTVHATKNIAAYNTQKTPLLAALTARKLKVANKNERTEAVQTATVEQVAMWMIGIYLLLEFIFEMCMCFCSYYDMRKMLEDCQSNPAAAQQILRNYQRTAPAVFADFNIVSEPEKVTVAPPASLPQADDDWRKAISELQQNMERMKPQYPTHTTVSGFQTKQPKSDASETAETVVQQQFQAETAAPETTPQYVKNPFTKQVYETEREIVFVDEDERYLRQKYKLAWRRLGTQENKATPKKNRDEIGKKLADLGYKIYEIEQPRNVIFKDKNGECYGTKSLIEKYKNHL